MCMRDLYSNAVRAALCFVSGQAQDNAFMDALGALEAALVIEAQRLEVSIFPQIEGMEDPEQIQKEVRRIQRAESKVLRACLSTDGIGASLRPMTRDRMMELAVARQETQRAEGGSKREPCNTATWRAWLDKMENYGAAIDSVSTRLIPPDEKPVQSVCAAFGTVIAGTPTPPTNRLDRLEEILRQNGIEPAGLIIHPGVVISEEWRKTPYLLIDIPIRELQIAVCEEYGQTTFVRHGIYPPSYWETHGKAMLKSDPCTYPVQDNKFWTQKICSHFDNTFLHKVQNVWNGLFIEEGRGAGRAVLTKDYLLRLVAWYQEKENADPSEPSKTVWGKTEDGEWIRLEENWKHISNELRTGMRGWEGTQRSLVKFLEEENLKKYQKQPLTEENLREMIELFQEMEGRDPVKSFEKKHKNPVWVRDENGKPFVDTDKSWPYIDFVLKSGGVLSEARTLAEFLDTNNLRKYSKPRGNGLAQTRCRTTEGGEPPAPPGP